MSEQKPAEIVFDSETKIRTEKYEKQKNKIKKFSEDIPGEIELKTVPYSKGPFGLAEYKVTGRDYNKLAENIQDLLIDQNKNTTKIIKEFSTIYETFTILDNDYIKRIIINLQVSQDANNKARESLELLKEEQNKTEINQREISQLLAHQETVVEVLQNYKEKLEEIKHLDDIDTLYSEVEQLKNDISVQTMDLKDQLEKIGQLFLSLSSTEQQISSLYKNMSEHSKDILQNGKQITDLEKRTTESESEIMSLYTRTEEFEEKQLDIAEKVILLTDTHKIQNKKMSEYELNSTEQLALINALEDKTTISEGNILTIHEDISKHLYQLNEQNNEISQLDEKIKTEVISMRTKNENMRKWMIINYMITFILMIIMIYLGTR